MKRSVVLIKCRTQNPEHTACLPPLGLMYLASFARQKMVADFTILDARLTSDESIFQQIRQTRPQLVGFSALTVESSHLYTLAASLKQHFPDIFIIAGGPHANAYPKDVLRQKSISALVLREGEVPLTQLLETSFKSNALSSVPSLAFRDGHNIKFTAPQKNLYSLDTLPLPAWDLINISAYARKPSMGLSTAQPYMPVITSRGCPFRCIYCHDLHGKSFRPRSPKNVLSEMKVLHDAYGIKNFRIVDDIFNFDLPRAKSILGAIIAEPWNIRLQFPNGIRGDIADDEFLELLYKAGTRQLSIAVETVSPRLQKKIRKHLNLSRVERTIQKAVSLGIYTQGFFILGLPSETEAEMRATIRFACESPLHTALFFIATPYAGTAMAEQISSTDNTQALSFEQYDSLKPYWNLSSASDQELRAMHRFAYRSFYSVPWRINRILRDYPDKQLLLPLLIHYFKRWIARKAA